MPLLARPRTLVLLVLLAAVIPAIAALLLPGNGADADIDAPVSATTRVPLPHVPPDGVVVLTRHAVGRPIPAGFVGLSFEYPALTRYAGRSVRALNPLLAGLIQFLTPGQRPILRIGGDSSDATWWPVAGVRRPPGVRFTLTRQWLAVARALTSALHARLILGLDLEAGRPRLALAEARALVGGLGKASIQALEIGNEPTRYNTFPWYRLPSGALIYARGESYDFRRFAGEFAAVAHRLRGIPLAGPTLGGYGWMPGLGSFISANRGLRLVTFHRYPLNRCHTRPGYPNYPSVGRLLSAYSSSGLARGLRPYVRLAHRHHLAFRVDEMNSVACGGKRGVSNTFASAGWALDALFAMAAAGVDGVNLHTFPGARYELFQFHHRAGHWSVRLRPEYYGLAMFARAAPPGARLLALGGAVPPRMRVWATRATDGTVRVTMINEDLHRARAVVVVSGQPDRSPGMLTTLTAPAPRATGGLRVGVEELRSLPGRRSRFLVELPPAGAATLNLA